MEFKGDKLRELWGNGKRLILEGIAYRVGKMSYGTYFLEPGPMRGETEGFCNGTLWLEKTNYKRDLYSVEI